MSGKTTALHKLLALALALNLGGFFALMTTDVLSQIAATPAGHLWASGQVMVNGAAAASGMTVLSESRVRTLENAEATVNLGRLGQIRLGPQTEMTVRFSVRVLGGKLHSGQAAISALPDVAIEVITAEGVVVSEGKQTALLAVETAAGNTSVAASRGEAKIISGGRVERVATGEEVTISAPEMGQPARRKPLLAGAAGAAVAGSLAALAAEGVNTSLARAGAIAPANQSTTPPNASPGPPGNSTSPPVTPVKPPPTVEFCGCKFHAVTAQPLNPSQSVTICHGLPNGRFNTLTISCAGLTGHFYANGTPRTGHLNDTCGACQ
jgi:hypothetical protein